MDETGCAVAVTILSPGGLLIGGGFLEETCKISLKSIFMDLYDAVIENPTGGLVGSDCIAVSALLR